MNNSLKMLIVVCTLFMSISQTFAADYYVAPSGHDSDPGTIDKPFATVSRGQQAAEPGDTIYLRGGTYKIEETQIAERKGVFAYVIALDKSGTQDKPIAYSAYKDEKPVFDFSSVKPAGYRVYAFSVMGSWLHLKGIEVTGVQVTIKEHTQSICFESNGSNNIFERLQMHDNQAIGIYHVRGSNNLFLNCDAWNNWDHTSEGGKGGNADGFGAHPAPGSEGNVFRGCRAWFNSDDGFDCINAFESVTFENCWAFYNGYSSKFESLADGNGFKAGGYGLTTAKSRVPEIIPRHFVKFCLSVGNKANGFYANHHPGGDDWVNNTAYRNTVNFNLLGRSLETHTDIDGTGHKLINNLSYKARSRELDKIDRAKSDFSNNSFDADLKLKETDFITLDERQLFRSRQPNGDLPQIDLLKPSARSLIEKMGAFPR